MDPTMLRYLAEARLADMHRQARRHALARAARQPRRAHGQGSGHHRPGLVGVVTGRARPRPARGSS
jgi:hypothetical protein